MSEELDRVLRAIEACDLQEIQPGRNEFCDGISANAFGYETKPEENKLFETHVQYTDVHLVRSGEEAVAVADVNRLTEVERDLEKDYIGSQGEKEAYVHLTEQHVLIVFPGEAHKTGYQMGDSKRVEKLVIKVPAI